MEQNTTELKRNRVTRFLGRVWRHLRDSRGLINTTDVIVAAGATVILASAVATVATGGADGAKYGKAQPDAVSIATAMSKFFADTGKWPGQVEILAAPASPFLAAGSASATGALPDFNVSLETGLTTSSIGFGGTSGSSTSCAAQSLAGATTASFGPLAVSTSNTRDINDFLVRKPAEGSYPNWKGPYLPTEIRSDVWDKVWLINVVPLFCAESITSPASGAASNETGGNLGYAWILSGGSNRTVQTNFQDAKLNPDADDAGVNMGKLVQVGAGGKNF